MVYKEILRLVPTMQSISLAKSNLKTMNKPKHDSSGKGIRANRGRAGCEETKLVGQGVKNIFGIELIKLQSNLIGKL